MRKDKHKYQIGDVLYEPSKMYKRVITWQIVDILVEEYVSGYKTIFVVESDTLGKATKYLTDVIHWCETSEEAAEELYGGAKVC